MAVRGICIGNAPFDTGAKVRALLPLIARYNLECREIQDLIAELRPQYLMALHQWQYHSPEWQQGSELDKEDLSTEASKKILKHLPINPGVNLSVLFHGQPEHPTYDDALIDQYGFGVLQTYMQFGHGRKTLYRIPATNRSREHFNQLVKAGLARQGQDIPLQELIQGLTMKELNALAAPWRGGKAFRQKPKVIPVLLEMSDLEDRLSSLIAFREWFQILPLPQKFSYLDLDILAASWKYDKAIAMLMAITMVAGNRSLHTHALYSRQGLTVPEWTMHLNCLNCQLCEEVGRQAAKDHTLPPIPVHVGCTCSISPAVINQEVPRR